jgi:hypothetical protein
MVLYICAPASLAPTVDNIENGVVYLCASKLSAYDTGSLGGEAVKRFF